MASVEIQLPRILEPVIAASDSLSFRLEANTLAEAWQVLQSEHPHVARHLFDESGALRTHVLCIWNDTYTRWLSDLEQPLADGDVLCFLQAVTGG